MRFIASLSPRILAYFCCCYDFDIASRHRVIIIEASIAIVAVRHPRHYRDNGAPKEEDIIARMTQWAGGTEISKWPLNIALLTIITWTIQRSINFFPWLPPPTLILFIKGTGAGDSPIRAGDSREQFADAPQRALVVARFSYRFYYTSEIYENSWRFLLINN